MPGLAVLLQKGGGVAEVLRLCSKMEMFSRSCSCGAGATRGRRHCQGPEDKQQKGGSVAKVT